MGGELDARLDCSEVDQATLARSGKHLHDGVVASVADGLVESSPWVDANLDRAIGLLDVLVVAGEDLKHQSLGVAADKLDTGGVTSSRETRRLRIQVPEDGARHVVAFRSKLCLEATDCSLTEPLLQEVPRDPAAPARRITLDDARVELSVGEEHHGKVGLGHILGLHQLEHHVVGGVDVGAQAGRTVPNLEEVVEHVTTRVQLEHLWALRKADEATLQ